MFAFDPGIAVHRTGLDLFAKAFPKRTFDVGIAEQHAVTFAAAIILTDELKPIRSYYLGDPEAVSAAEERLLQK